MNNNIFFELDKQAKTKNETLIILNEYNEIDNDIREQIRNNQGLWEIVNFILRKFGIRELTEDEIFELMSLDIFANISVPKKYYDYFIIVKIFVFRIIVKILEYRRNKANDNNDNGTHGDGQDNTIKTYCTEVERENGA